MVLPGSRSHGSNLAGTTPRCASMKMCKPVAFWLPSACGMAVTPMNEPSLMSESWALVMAVIRGLSASLIVAALPSRSLAAIVLPSIFSIVPRTRVGLASCAQAAGASAMARPAATAARRMIVLIRSSLLSAAACCRRHCRLLSERRREPAADIDVLRHDRAVRLFLRLHDDDLRTGLE